MSAVALLIASLRIGNRLVGDARRWTFHVAAATSDRHLAAVASPAPILVAARLARSRADRLSGKCRTLAGKARNAAMIAGRRCGSCRVSAAAARLQVLTRGRECSVAAEADQTATCEAKSVLKPVRRLVIAAAVEVAAIAPTSRGN